MAGAEEPFTGNQCAAVVEALATGCGAPPWELIEARLVEKSGWTFTQIDEQPADRVFSLLQVWGLRAEMGDG
jgi:hypothetical protein